MSGFYLHFIIVGVIDGRRKRTRNRKHSSQTPRDEIRVEFSQKSLDWIEFGRSRGFTASGCRPGDSTSLPRLICVLALVISVNILLLIDFLNYIARPFMCLVATAVRVWTSAPVCVCFQHRFDVWANTLKRPRNSSAKPLSRGESDLTRRE